MKDPELEALAAAVERHLSVRRGAQHVLSPPDFALLREWHAAGVPLSVVLAAIDRGFEGERPPASLQACRRLVSQMAARQPAAPVPLARAAADDEPADIPERLRALELAIANAGRTTAFEKAGRRLRELIDLTAVAREPNWAYLRDKLEELDRLVEDAALEALDAAESRSFEAEAARAVERQRGRVAGEALDAALTRYLRRRARERFALPRVGGA